MNVSDLVQKLLFELIFSRYTNLSNVQNNLSNYSNVQKEYLCYCRLYFLSIVNFSNYNFCGLLLTMTQFSAHAFNVANKFLRFAGDLNFFHEIFCLVTCFFDRHDSVGTEGIQSNQVVVQFSYGTTDRNWRRCIV